jgi:Sulfotransferase domain
VGAVIFGIGFSKTGTTSLASALRRLGYTTIHGDGRGSWPGADEGATLIRAIEAGDYRLPTFELFEAFVDNPYFIIWKQLDNMFPRAKFILTLRDENAWIDSCIRYYHGRRVRPMRSWLFGEHADPSASRCARDAWLDAYRKHNNAILHHFSSAEDRFVVMNLSEGDGWEKLCGLLGAPIPAKPFPHMNQTRTLILPPSSYQEKIQSLFGFKLR